jgi:hypothetical protein
MVFHTIEGNDMNLWELKKNLECDKLIQKYYLKKRTWCYKCRIGFETEKELKYHERRHADG